jgi:hypothetical protein
MPMQKLSHGHPPFCTNFAAVFLTAKIILVFVLGKKISESYFFLTAKNISAFVFGTEILENYSLRILSIFDSEFPASTKLY